MNTTKKPLPKIEELASLPREELLNRIKHWLDDLCEYGLSRGEIAEIVGLPRVSIWRLRNGRHKSTQIEHGLRIAGLHAKVFKKGRKQS
jgi:hypothetical protein